MGGCRRHFVFFSLLWQSKHARTARARVCGESHLGLLQHRRVGVRTPIGRELRERRNSPTRSSAERSSKRRQPSRLGTDASAQAEDAAAGVDVDPRRGRVGGQAGHRLRLPAESDHPAQGTSVGAELAHRECEPARSVAGAPGRARARGGSWRCRPAGGRGPELRVPRLVVQPSWRAQYSGGAVGRRRATCSSFRLERVLHFRVKEATGSDARSRRRRPRPARPRLRRRCGRRR